MPTPQPAATLIVLRERETGPEVLLVKRHNKLSFAPDYWVFPGGKVDVCDYETGETIEDYARNTAVRETHEETSLLIFPSKLVSSNHWTTPPGYNKRFATWFFITHLINEQVVKVDGREIVDFVWVRPKVGLDLYHQGKMQMMLPTQTALLELYKFDSCEQVLKWYRDRDIEYR